MLEVEAVSNSKTDSRRRRVRGDPTSRKLVRFMAGMTLQQVSSATGISVTRLSEWENEKRVIDPKEEAAIALLEGVRRVEMARSRR